MVIQSLEDGDFSEALKGVDAVAHVASPWHLNGKKWDDYKIPAVKGTTNVLEQAAKFPNIKAIAVMSSAAAVVDSVDPFTKHAGQTYTEKNWLPQTNEDCEKAVDKGDGMAQLLWYCVSKKEAELAGGRVHKNLKPGYSLAFACPPMIFGPAIHHNTTNGKDLANADVSTSLLYQAFIAGKDASLPPTLYTGWADVRAVAQSLYEMITRRANGRYLIYNGNYDYEILNRVAHKLRPDLDKKGYIPRGNPDGPTAMSGGTYDIDATKSVKELGVKYDTLEEMASDTLKQYEAMGIVKA